MTAAKPQPAVGQVWEFTGSDDCRQKMAPTAIERVDVGCGRDGEGEVIFHDGCAQVHWMRSLSTWRCIGIETAHGRVMVGERRLSDHSRTDTPVVTVSRVANMGVVAVRPDGGDFEVGPAALFASWPLLPPAPAPSKTGPLARLCAHVAHTIGLPIGEVTAEETPRDGMIRVSVPANVTGLRCDEAWESAREMLPLGIALSVKARRDPLALTWDRVETPLHEYKPASGPLAKAAAGALRDSALATNRATYSNLFLGKIAALSASGILPPSVDDAERPSRAVP